MAKYKAGDNVYILECNRIVSPVKILKWIAGKYGFYSDGSLDSNISLELWRIRQREVHNKEPIYNE